LLPSLGPCKNLLQQLTVHLLTLLLIVLLPLPLHSVESPAAFQKQKKRP
jgi:hypothetical protein